jgi:hypothetical protein
MSPNAIRRPSHSTVVAYLALFVALGGTAAALEGKNSVDSGDLRNNQVKSADVRNDTKRGGGLRERDIAANAVGSDELQQAATFGEAGEVLSGDYGVTMDSDGVTLLASAGGEEAQIARFGDLGSTFPGLQLPDGLILDNGRIQVDEVSPEPPNPGSDRVFIYARSTSGFTQLVARFPDGTVVPLGQETP